MEGPSLRPVPRKDVQAGRESHWDVHQLGGGSDCMYKSSVICSLHNPHLLCPLFRQSGNSGNSPAYIHSAMSDPRQTQDTNSTSTNPPEPTTSSSHLHWPHWPSALKSSRSKKSQSQSGETTEPDPEPDPESESTFSKPYTTATSGPTVHAEVWDREQAEKEARRRAVRDSVFDTVFSQEQLAVIYTQASRRTDWDEIESKVLPKLRTAAETAGKEMWGFAKDTAGDLFKSWLEGELGLG